MEQPLWFPAFAWALVGLALGSFLNVAIHRLPLEGETVSKPRRSRCPQCRHTLSWRENVPLVSWLLQRGKCRHCAWPIPWRYPLVELLTAGLFWLAASRLPLWLPCEGLFFDASEVAERGGWWPLLAPWALLLVHSTVLAGLIVATFVDFHCYEIPDEVSIGGMLLAPLASLLVPELHRATWIALELSEGPCVDRAGALGGALAGMAVGGGVIWTLGWVGSRIYGRDAMGFGDVKLLAAGGGFVGPGGALVAFLIATFAASLVGVANMLRYAWLVAARSRARGSGKGLGHALRIGRIAGRYLPFGPYLALGIGIVLLAWNDVFELLRELAF